jgi:hypothetical protein
MKSYTHILIWNWRNPATEPADVAYFYHEITLKRTTPLTPGLAQAITNRIAQEQFRVYDITMSPRGMQTQIEILPIGDTP